MTDPTPYVILPSARTGMFRQAIFAATTGAELEDLDAVAAGEGLAPTHPSRVWIATKRAALAAPADGTA